MAFSAEPPQKAPTRLRPVRLALAGPITALCLSAGFAMAAFVSPEEAPSTSPLDLATFLAARVDVISPVVASQSALQDDAWFSLTAVTVVEPVDDVVLEVPARPAIVPGSNREIGQEMAAEYGWTGIEWQCLDNLWEKESNWRHLAENPSSGAYGIPQALPGEKMAAAGSDWKTNPATQIEWGLGYIETQYGTPCSAWGSWSDRSPHWY